MEKARPKAEVKKAKGKSSLAVTGKKKVLVKKTAKPKATGKKKVEKVLEPLPLAQEDISQSPLLAALSGEAVSSSAIASPGMDLDVDSEIEADELAVGGGDDADEDLDELTDDLADEFVDDAFPRGLPEENDDVDLTDDLSDELGTEKFFRDNDSGLEDDDEDISRSW